MPKYDKFDFRNKPDVKRRSTGIFLIANIELLELTLSADFLLFVAREPV